MAYSFNDSFGRGILEDSIQIKLGKLSSDCSFVIEDAFKVREAGISILSDAQKGWVSQASDASIESANAVVSQQQKYRYLWSSALKSYEKLNENYDQLSAELIEFRGELAKLQFRAKLDVREPLSKCQQLLEDMGKSKKNASHSFLVLSKIWTMISA